jgi:hypothetical protein
MRIALPHADAPFGQSVNAAKRNGRGRWASFDSPQARIA